MTDTIVTVTESVSVVEVPGDTVVVVEEVVEVVTAGTQGPQGPTGATGAAGAGVASGGSTGQYLRKASGTDYDTEWANVTAGVSSFNGRTGAVTPQSGDYTASLVGLGSVANALQLVAANNLSDLTNASTARTNLGLGSLATLSIVSLIANVTGILPLANGGTGADLSAIANNRIPYVTGGVLGSSNGLTFDGTKLTAASIAAFGSSGQLQYNNAGVIDGAAWSTIASSGSLYTATCAANTDKPITLAAKSTTATINNIAITANVATVTTSATHGFIVGRTVALSGLTTVTSLNNLRFVILSVTSTTFTFYCSVSSQASTSETGSAVSESTSVPLIELQDGASRATVRLSSQPSGTASGAPTTTPMTAAGILDVYNHATNFQNTPRTFPWLTWHCTTMSNHGQAARIAFRQGYSASTTYDAAAIDLGVSEGSLGRIRFFVGGSGNGTPLVYAGEFMTNGRLSLTQLLAIVNSTGQNAQFGYTNYPDTNASLLAAGQANKSFVLQYSSTANSMELQLYNSSTVDGGISNQGNWWLGGTSGSATTRMLLKARQTTNCTFAAQAIASQSGNLLEFRASGGSAVSAFDVTGAWDPPSMDDASAANDRIYYSTTAGKVVYKDSGGSVNPFY